MKERRSAQFESTCLNATNEKKQKVPVYFYLTKNEGHQIPEVNVRPSEMFCVGENVTNELFVMQVLICSLCLVYLQKFPLSTSFLSASPKKLNVFADDIRLTAISLNSAFGSYFVFFLTREFEMLRCTLVQAHNSHTVTRLSNTPPSLSFFGARLLHTSHTGKLCRHLLLLFL